MILNPNLPMTCPVCGEILSLGAPSVRGGTTMLEVRCDPCRRAVVLRALPMW